MTSKPWDDRRLAAAFTDRFDRAAPRSLMIDTLGQVRNTARRPRWWPDVDRSAALGLVATTAVVVAVVYAAQPPPRPLPSAVASQGAGGPSLTATPRPTSPDPTGGSSAPAVPGFPATIEGLSVRSIADVIAAPSPPGIPEAVAGWFTHLPLTPCPMDPATKKALRDCNRYNLVLAETDAPLVERQPDGSWSTTGPSGPAIRPVTLPGVEYPRLFFDGSPRQVIIVVHSGDARADRDGPGDPVAADEHVLDQIAWVDGSSQGPAEWIAQPDLKPVESPQQVLRETAGGVLVAPGTWPISISGILARDLPSLGIVSDRIPPSLDVVWVVRLVGREPGVDEGPQGSGYVIVRDGQIVETVWTPW